MARYDQRFVESFIHSFGNIEFTPVGWLVLRVLGIDMLEKKGDKSLSSWKFWLLGLCSAWVQECYAGGCLDMHWAIRGASKDFVSFKVQAALGLLRDGDGSTWRSRKLTTNRILRGNTGVLVKCPVLAYVVDSVKI